MNAATNLAARILTAPTPSPTETGGAGGDSQGGTTTGGTGGIQFINPIEGFKQLGLNGSLVLVVISVLVFIGAVRTYHHMQKEAEGGNVQKAGKQTTVFGMSLGVLGLGIVFVPFMTFILSIANGFFSSGIANG